MAKITKTAQPMDLNVMQPTAEQRVRSSAVEQLPPNAVRTMPERDQRFGSAVRGFAGQAAKLLGR
jgi:hypothetical protein